MKSQGWRDLKVMLELALAFIFYVGFNPRKCSQWTSEPWIHSRELCGSTIALPHIISGLEERADSLSVIRIFLDSSYSSSREELWFMSCDRIHVKIRWLWMRILLISEASILEHLPNTFVDFLSFFLFVLLGKVQRIDSRDLTFDPPGLTLWKENRNHS